MLALCEWRKLIRLPALWGFLALCLAFNALLILGDGSGRERFNEASAAAEALGQRVGRAFLDGLAQGPAGEGRDRLLQSASGLTDLFETYDAGVLADFYTGVVSSSPTAARWMAWKYGLLADRVDRLAEADAALDLYAGPATHHSHQFLFGTLFRAILAESAALAMLAALYLMGYERLFRTEEQLCAARTGRRLWRVKALAAVPAALGLYALLALCSLGLYFSLWDYGGVWDASVSSQFNYLTDLLFRRPFLTWADFTVAGYLAAALALGGLLTASFALLAAVWGALLRNVYAAALALMLLCAGGLTLTALLAQAGLWTAYLLSCLQPAVLWLSAGAWFTELGLNAFLPWQETLGTVLNLLLLGGGTALALRRFNRKDLA